MKTKFFLFAFVLAAIVVLWQPAPGLANMDLVFALDISMEMSEGCPLDGGSPLQVAKKRIAAAAEILLADPEIRVGLLGFATGPAEIYNSPEFSVRDITAALETIESTENEKSSLHNGLRESLKLLLENGGGGGSRIVIYTNGGSDRSRDVLDLIAGLAANGIQVQINLFSDEAGADLDALAVEDQVIINHVGCRTVPSDPVQIRMIDSLKTIVAQQTGADVATVTQSSDLHTDLGAGQAPSQLRVDLVVTAGRQQIACCREYLQHAPRILPDRRQAVRHQDFPADRAGQQFAVRQQAGALSICQPAAGLLKRVQQAAPVTVELGGRPQAYCFPQPLMLLCELGPNGRLFSHVHAIGQAAQQVGDTRQGRYHHQHLFAVVEVPPGLLADGIPAGRRTDTGAAEFHHDPLTACLLLHVPSSKRKRPPLGRPFDSCRAGCGLRR